MLSAAMFLIFFPSFLAIFYTYQKKFWRKEAEKWTNHGNGECGLRLLLGETTDSSDDEFDIRTDSTATCL